ncbi:TetR/AcrR family transcriptional regulator [Actinomadura rubrisoli]|uniref:TetR/AcrR family transcriptional regulator n=1 Tax=Actinomadura rubrisoli TaxID=2530368 RepID=A0A4V2YV82_9ACTN|nr:helix-turn-helix domain-containing protein [Actinomadura rubrisoli]TDD80537.1 TetR/AcrR family transcriptional regulator [Actinomadura rubrisoli]
MHPSDRTARGKICRQALSLFADHGADAVTLRQVAAAADVSPSLVVHHFGGKKGLREAVNDYTLAVLGRFLDGLSVAPGAAGDDRAGHSMVHELVTALPDGSPVLAQLARLLTGDEAAGRQIFRRWHQVRLARLDAMVGMGQAPPPCNRPLRAAWLTANDLAVLLLRNRLREVLGGDPLAPGRSERWTEESAVMCGGEFRVVRRQCM